MQAFEKVPSGIAGLDEILDFIRMGDNVVWQVTSIEEYIFFVNGFVDQGLRDERNMIYIRFAQHDPLIEDRHEVKRYEINPEEGFEAFTVNVREIITKEGRDTLYIFDSLSELQVVWSTDLMMGNFFQVTCPYLFELNTVAYFPVLRGKHSYDAIARIRDTTQLLLDVYRDGDVYYLHPLKAWNRYSPTMFLPHRYDGNGNAFVPLMDGFSVSRFYTVLEKSQYTDDQNFDSWERYFSLARLQYHQGVLPDETCQVMCRTMVSRDKRMAELVDKHFSPEDFFTIRDRMIGTGMIGGKACGMLLARKIVQTKLPQIGDILEPHDSFYIGSDVFYTYIVQNDCWALRVRQRTEEGYFSAAQALQDGLRKGVFSEKLKEQFRRMLSYFGQSPIIVRSSSFLEDGFGNAFAGKYESVFCVGGGNPEERLKTFEEAVKTVYASVMDQSALEYRQRRGLGRRDEQMALLVQRVSGSFFGDCFMPAAAGVGYSYSPYRWMKTLDPKAGMLRLVMGLGTRAVDRTEGDYPRLVSLDRPKTVLLNDIGQRHRYSQHTIDMIDLNQHVIKGRKLDDLLQALPTWYRQIVLTHDTDAERMLRQRGQNRDVWFVSCDGLVANRKFTEIMQGILKVLQDEYDYPVDIEFTVNLQKSNDFVVNLLQCRPLQAGMVGGKIHIPEAEKEDVLFDIVESSMGRSCHEEIHVVVMVDPYNYYQYPYNCKSKVAQAIGEINRYYQGGEKNLMLMVPGRIGTSSPELGIPVVFSDISCFRLISEISYSAAGYMPELSYGSHIFQDLVEADILYTAIFENSKTKIYRPEILQNNEDSFLAICPESQELVDIVHVFEIKEKPLHLYFDMVDQRVLCCFQEKSFA